MALPPKGDPLRPLMQAAQSFAAIAGLFAIITAMLVLIIFSRAFLKWWDPALFGCCGGASAMCYLESWFLRKKRLQAVFVGMVLAGMGFVICLALQVATLVSNGRRDIEVWQLVWLAALAGFEFSFVRLILQLRDGRIAIEAESIRGFQTIPVGRVREVSMLSVEENSAQGE